MSDGFRIRRFHSVSCILGADSGYAGAQDEGSFSSSLFADREGNMRVFEGAHITSNITCSGTLWVGRGAEIEGNVEVALDLIMDEHSRITGSASVAGSAHFKEGAIIAGDVHISGRIFRGVNPPPGLLRNPMMPSMPQLNVSTVTGDAAEIVAGGKLAPGALTVIHERKADLSSDIFRQLLSEGKRCLLIGRDPPERVKNLRSLDIDEENVIWLTNLVGRRCFNPTHLSSILNAITRFVETPDRSFVLIEGVEYLIINNGFDQVLKFINRIEDAIVTGNASVILSIDPRTLDAQSLALLERGAEVITSADRDIGGMDMLRAEMEERLKEESVRRKQLEERLDDYLSRIENAVLSIQNRDAGRSADPAPLTELSETEKAIRREIEKLQEQMEERERRLIDMLDSRFGKENKSHAENSNVIALLEEQLRENSELLLKAVLLAERLSAEKVQKLQDKL